MDLRGARALVTGASSGIGAATARALAAEGVALALCGRRTAVLEGLADDIAASGAARPAVFPVDLATRGAWRVCRPGHRPRDGTRPPPRRA